MKTRMDGMGGMLGRAGIGLLLLAAGLASAASPKSCMKLELNGEVQTGQEWRAPIGQGWVFRLLPIHPAQGPAGEAYSGWDLVVDREQPAGFPDALLLATPPYNSINEHELGTTFGLRAQDVIGWNPRSFRFLTKPEALREGQQLFLGLKSGAGKSPADVKALERLMALSRDASAGQFRILDARLVPGVGDAAPWAQNWALAAMRTPHSYVASASGESTPLGELRWVRFSLTLWLPKGWKTPADVTAKKDACE